MTVSFGVIMPKVTSYMRKRIACLHKDGFCPIQKLKALRRENLQGSLESVTRIINKLQKTGSTEKCPRSGRPTKLPEDAKAFTEMQMRISKHSDSKTTGQAWNRRELLHCAKIASQTGMNYAAHPLLSFYESS